MKHKARKRFGQNFLQDGAIIGRIIEVINPQREDNLLEIGPGLGALTKPLLKRVKTLNAVEIDRDLHEHLNTLIDVEGVLHLLCEDALKVDYSGFGNNLRIVGNLPYNISTPLLIHLLRFAPFIEDMHFMLQKEVVLRLAASPGTKAYGRLTVLMHYYYEVEYLFTVPPGAFFPAPKVDSAIVRLKSHQNPPYEFVAQETLERFLALAFAMKRKTLANNLKGILDAEQLAALEIDGSKRPEQISVTEYVKMAKFVAN